MLETVAIMCLALNVYWEARDQEIAGQVAVAQVVMNRVADPRYPNDACGVIRDGGETKHKCQFSWYCDGKADIPRDVEAWETALVVASGVLAGSVHSNLKGVTMYHAVYAQPYWSDHPRVHPVAYIDDHIFYTEEEEI
jgi:spore germination cell wall hydrolase CwlJ-like protein